MSIKFIKRMSISISALLLLLGSMNVATARPSLCKPPVLTRTTCTDCHKGVPSKSTYIKNGCKTAANKAPAPKPPAPAPTPAPKPPAGNGDNGNNNNGGHGNDNGGDDD